MNCLFWQFFPSCIFIFTNYLGTLRIIYLCCISTHTLHTYFRVLQESWKPSLTMGTLILVTPPTILLTKTKTLAKLQKVKLFFIALEPFLGSVLWLCWLAANHCVWKLVKKSQFTTLRAKQASFTKSKIAIWAISAE